MGTVGVILLIVGLAILVVGGVLFLIWRNLRHSPVAPAHRGYQRNQANLLSHDVQGLRRVYELAIDARKKQDAAQDALDDLEVRAIPATPAEKKDAKDKLDEVTKDLQEKEALVRSMERKSGREFPDKFGWL